MFLQTVNTSLLSVVQFSHSVMSDPLRPHRLQNTRLPCPSPTPGAFSNSCHPNVSSSVIQFPCLKAFQASGSFPTSQFFPSGDQSIGTSTSVLLMNIQGWFPLRLSGLILQSRRLSRVFSSTTVRKQKFFSSQPYLWSLTSIHNYWKNHSFD